MQNQEAAGKGQAGGWIAELSGEGTVPTGPWIRSPQKTLPQKFASVALHSTWHLILQVRILVGA